ncbi:hypothetical protein BC834DRAFT_1041779 [Gloeopeniophorella convolvens]|nr:hypothetical protein BC834DRAFT_1041779 [Gloeopeniophorella convolvens]
MTGPPTPRPGASGSKKSNPLLGDPPRGHDEPHRRAPLLRELHRLGTSIVADTLDWDALMHRELDFGGSMLSLDSACSALQHDRETYYHLWVAVQKVLQEAGPDATRQISGVRSGGRDQIAVRLVDAALEQFLAEIGSALMDFVDGPHCTVVDPRCDGDPAALCAKARSLVARFEALGHDRGSLLLAVRRPRDAIPATETGIEAAATLQREDAINVCLCFVSGIGHAAACARAGAAAVSLSIAAVSTELFSLLRSGHDNQTHMGTQMREWDRNRAGHASGSKVTDAAIDEAQTAAAYFAQHGAQTTLIARTLGHVNDAAELAMLPAVALGGAQARDAEWHTTYPAPVHALPDAAVRRAASLPPPKAIPVGRGALAGRQMDARALSALTAILYSALGESKADMAVIAQLAEREIAWQLALQRPMYVPRARAVDTQPPPPRKRKRVLAPDSPHKWARCVDDTYAVHMGSSVLCSDEVEERAGAPCEPTRGLWARLFVAEDVSQWHTEAGKGGSESGDGADAEAFPTVHWWPNGGEDGAARGSQDPMDEIF